MNILYKHQEPKALEKKDDISDKRELYQDQRKLVILNVEMDSAEAWESFKKLPAHVLPPLPHGYLWVRANHNYSIISQNNAKEHDISLVLYGPDEKKRINFICCVDKVTTYSFGHTKTDKEIKRNYPMRNEDFRVQNYDYSKKKYKSHVRGHLIDHKDTITISSTWSTYDLRNYVPEPPEYEWGLGFRRLKVAELRKKEQGGAYAQMNEYGDAPLITMNGIKVPEDVRFYAYDNNNYQAMEVYHVNFEENMKRKKGIKVLDNAKKNFQSSLEASPIVESYNPSSSDRAFRLQGRNAAKKEYNIANRQTRSRFFDNDQKHAAIMSAENEFESGGRQFHAGVVVKNNKPLSHQHIKQSIFFASELSELDQNYYFSEESKAEGKLYFKENGQDIEDMADHFNRLCAAP